MADTDDWVCEGLPPQAHEYGVLCFFADRGARNCATAEECAESMAAGRKLLFQRINELAAGNDPTGAYGYLEQTFTSPGQLLGGGDPPPPDPNGGNERP